MTCRVQEICYEVQGTSFRGLSNSWTMHFMETLFRVTREKSLKAFKRLLPKTTYKKLQTLPSLTLLPCSLPLHFLYCLAFFLLNIFLCIMAPVGGGAPGTQPVTMSETAPKRMGACWEQEVSPANELMAERLSMLPVLQAEWPESSCSAMLKSIAPGA